MKEIRILLADDHTVVRKGLRLLLETQPGFAVIADASDGREAVAQAEKLAPDVVVIDVAMPILNGIEAARQITARQPQIAVVFLSISIPLLDMIRISKIAAGASWRGEYGDVNGDPAVMAFWLKRWPDAVLLPDSLP